MEKYSRRRKQQLVKGIFYRFLDALLPIVVISFITIMLNNFGLFKSATKVVAVTGFILLGLIVWEIYCSAAYYKFNGSIWRYYAVNFFTYTVISVAAILAFYYNGDPAASYIFLPYKFFYFLSKSYDITAIKVGPLSYLFSEKYTIGKTRSAIVVYALFMFVVLIVPVFIKKRGRKL